MARNTPLPQRCDIGELEGINLTGEDLGTRGRPNASYWFIQELHPRYLLGARYKFN